MAGSETGIAALHETKELAGLTVVEIGHSLAGRLVVKLLTDQGADATCVDWPEGAPDGLPPVAWDDGRETEPLHLCEAADRELFLAKLSGADLLVSSLTPKRLEEVGLGTAALHQRNPGLIVLRLSPFPDEAGRAEEVLDDELISAELGYNRTGGNRQVAGDADAPLAEPLSIPSGYAALFGAAYVGAALLQRDGGRTKIAIDVSLFGAGMMGINGSLVKIENPNFVDPNVTPYRLPMVARYRCGDGRYIQFQGSTPNTLHQALAGLDELDWWPEAIASLRQLPSKAAEDSWRARFAAKFNERTAAEWERAISEAGGASAMCRSRSEWVAEPHASSTGIIAGRSGTDPDSPVVLGPAMRTLQGDDAAASGSSAAANARSVVPDRPLEGVRVLDLTIILAGPSTSRILAEFGAEVIKVDPAERATWPGVLPTNWLDVNRSKRSMIVDLKTPEGREILWKLIDTAEVFVESYRLGRLESLGFGYDAVRKRNPRIVYASVNAYDFGGPFSERPGWEPNAQAMTGMQTARSAPGEVRPIVPSINDYGTALLGVTGIFASLRAARSTGLGRRVLVSLARTASFFQTKELSWHEQLVERNDLDAIAFHPSKGGWIATRSDGTDGTEVAKRVADLSPDAAAELLRKEGIAAVVVRKPHELLDLDWVHAAGLLCSWDHPVWGTVTNAVAGGRSNAFSQHADRASPQPGEDTRAVLGELGYGEVEIDALYAAGIARGPLPLWGGD